MAAMENVVSLPGTPDVAGYLALGIIQSEVGAFKRPFAGGKEILTVYRADTFAAVAGGWGGVNRSTSEHGSISKNNLTTCSVCAE